MTWVWNNYDKKEVIKFLKNMEKKWAWNICQEETGEEGHYIRGCCFFKKTNLSYLKKINEKIHWKQASNVVDQTFHCSKKENRTGDLWVYGIDIQEDVPVCEPYGWQLEVLELIKNKPDDRKIYWFYEEEGCYGKSALAKYLSVNTML